MNAHSKVETASMRAPFPPHQISKLPKETKAQIDARKNREAGCMVWKCPECGGAHHKDAVHLDYVGHAALTDRLLDVDPSWSWEPVAFNSEGLPAFDRNGGLWIKLTVNGTTRLGYGGADGKQGTDAVKEIIGDALRNAAMRFGAALDLWHKGELHLDDEPEQAAGGQSEQRAVSPRQSETKGWREPNSPLSTPSKLHAELARLNRELAGCGDSEMVYGLTGTKEWQEFVRVAGLHSPHYLHGGEPAPPEFRGLLNTAADMVAQFDAETAQGMTDLARV
jgi:hypothetical protein